MPNDYGMVRSDRKEIVSSILTPYLTAKKDKTILTQYVRVAPGPDGVVRTVLSPVVTETGRLASGESFVDPYSTNMQNISKTQGFQDPLYRVRDCFIADPGMVLMASDLDKAEAVVVGFESRNWEFYDRLVTGQDVHKWVAAQAYHGGNEKAVAKQERQRCKNVLYASFYMAGISRITRTINKDAKTKADKLTESDVESVYNVIMDILELDVWWDEVWKDLMDPTTHGGARWLENALQFRRMFYHPDEHKRHKEAVNFYPQATVASQIDRALLAAEDLEEPGQFEFLLQVHDELLWQVAEDKVDYYAPKVIDMMQMPFPRNGRDVFIPASLEVGRRWEAFRGPAGEPLDPENTLERMEGYHV